MEYVRWLGPIKGLIKFYKVAILSRLVSLAGLDNDEVFRNKEVLISFTSHVTTWLYLTEGNTLVWLSFR